MSGTEWTASDFPGTLSRIAGMFSAENVGLENSESFHLHPKSNSTQSNVPNERT